MATGIWWARNVNETEGSKKVVVEELPLVPLKAGSVKPRGWMLDPMKRDIQTGLAGNYERFGHILPWNFLLNRSVNLGM